MAEFIAIPNFSIYKDGTWAKPEQWWLHSECIYQSDLIGINGLSVEDVNLITIISSNKSGFDNPEYNISLFFCK